MGVGVAEEAEGRGRKWGGGSEGAEIGGDFEAGERGVNEESVHLRSGYSEGLMVCGGCNWIWRDWV